MTSLAFTGHARVLNNLSAYVCVDRPHHPLDPLLCETFSMSPIITCPKCHETPCVCGYMNDEDDEIRFATITFHPL